MMICQDNWLLLNIPYTIQCMPGGIVILLFGSKVQAIVPVNAPTVTLAPIVEL